MGYTTPTRVYLRIFKSRLSRDIYIGSNTASAAAFPVRAPLRPSRYWGRATREAIHSNAPLIGNRANLEVRRRCDARRPAGARLFFFFLLLPPLTWNHRIYQHGRTRSSFSRSSAAVDDGDGYCRRNSSCFLICAMAFSLSEPSHSQASRPTLSVCDVPFEVKLKMAVALCSEMSHPHGDRSAAPPHLQFTIIVINNTQIIIICPCNS